MQRTHWYCFVSFLGLLALPSLAQSPSSVPAAPPSPPPASSPAVAPSQAAKKDGGPLVINIDSPSFRKMAFAAPSFVAKGTLGADGQKFAKEGPAELERLMSFSGYFNIVSEQAYKDLLAKASASVNSTAAPEAPAKANDKAAAPKSFEESASPKSGMAGIDVPQWKAVGVETLTLAELSEASGLLNLSIKTIDMNRGEVLVGKRYTGISKNEYSKAMRRYADAVLSAYTNRTGIFNSKIVFIGRKFKGAAKQVYVADFDGSHVSQVTTTNAPHLSPEWSKDGRYIVYTSYEMKNPDLYLYDTQTAKHRRLSSKPGLNSGGNFSPDSQLIAFTGSQDGEAELYLVKPDGTGRRLFIKGDGLDVDPSFSPDGSKLAFVSGRYGNPHIFVANIKWENSEPKVIGDQRLTYAGWYNATPAWTPEGDRIAFAGYDKDIDRFDIFTMDPNGQNMERLTLKAGDNESPTYSPNGQLIIFHSNRATDNSNAKSQAQLYIMNRDGSGQRVIDTGLYDAQTPNWSPQLPYE